MLRIKKFFCKNKIPAYIACGGGKVKHVRASLKNEGVYLDPVRRKYPTTRPFFDERHLTHLMEIPLK